MADANAEPAAGSSSSNESVTQIEPIRMPTIEEIRAQEVWNNCAVKSVASGVMGLFQNLSPFRSLALDLFKVFSFVLLIMFPKLVN